MEPGKTRVMEPISEEQVKNRENTVYQVKWDGVRMLSFIGKQQVVLQNRRGIMKTSAFPELGCLATTSYQPLILDGEVVSIKNGRPNFSAILRRNFTSIPSPAAPPISYIVFDILYMEGRDIRDNSLAERQEKLARLELKTGPVTIIDNFKDGEQLLNFTMERGWEGIVSKELSSPYVEGKSSYWKKIKNKQTEILSIVGYVSNQGQLSSVLVGTSNDDQLHLAGAVGSGLSSSGRKLLLEILKGLSITNPPISVKRKHENWHWVKPLLQAEVEFMEWTETLTLRAPVFKNLLWEGKKFELP